MIYSRDAELVDFVPGHGWVHKYDGWAVASLAHIPIIPLEVLAETWPREYEAPEGLTLQEDPDPAEDGSPSESPPRTPSPPLEVPSLVDIAFSDAVRQCAETGEGFKSLEHLVNLPEKASAVIEALKAADTIISDDAVDWLNTRTKT